MPVTVLQHPLAKVHLSVLRDRNTDAGTFRSTLNRLASLVGLEATSNLKLKDVAEVSFEAVRTRKDELIHQLSSPVGGYVGHEIGEKVGLAPILRSGVGMEDALLSLLPGAPVYHLGLFRDPVSLQAIEYYSRLPHDVTVDRIFILDPMVATGGTAIAALKMMKEWGLDMDGVSFLGIIASQPAVDAVVKVFPQVQFYFATIDAELTAKGYVLPGCGDVGDRLYSSVTK